MADGSFVAYYRVSTTRQGKSGLGLEAQEQAVRDFLNGGDWQLVGEFTEVESGKRQDNRPQLAQAIWLARVKGARLLVAKLDRLSRNAAFLMQLRDSGVDFVCCDMPNANSFTVGVLALVAQQEREAISARTKAALAAKKARGERLGTPSNLDPVAAEKGRIMGLEARQRNADAWTTDLVPLFEQMRAKGVTSLAGQARCLNEQGVPTRRGATWTATTVRNALRRMSVG